MNDRQYQITNVEAERFRQAIEEASTHETKLSPRMHRAVLDGLQSQHEDLFQEIKYFENSMVECKGIGHGDNPES